MIVCSVTISTFFRYASSQSMGSAARAALTHLKGQSDYALINPRDYALNIQTWSVRSILEITVWLILARESRIFFARIVQNHEKHGKNARKRQSLQKKWPFFVRGWDTSSSCVKKCRKYDTARAVLGHFSRFSYELLTKTAIFWHSSYNQKLKVVDFVIDRDIIFGQKADRPYIYAKP